MRRFHTLLPLTILLLAISCGTQSGESPLEANTGPQEKLFTLLKPYQSGVQFLNAFPEEVLISPYIYINSYNGGGIAAGDINNDGLTDLYFTGNLSDNKLFLNKGNMEFEDITTLSRTGAVSSWCFGVTMADVNADGYLDIYVCAAASDRSDRLRENLLYINNGDLTFKESAQEYGLNNDRWSVQSSFFDYDLDGDLDLFLGNHPQVYSKSYEHSIKMKKDPQLNDSDRLYRNNGDNTFTDVTLEAGILNHGFTLGVVIGDINRDGWPDIYVANDHAEPDNYYMNNGDGTFTDVALDKLRHMCNFSMGVDLADFNNDSYLDVIVVDMLAQDNYRQKTQMKGMSPKMFWKLEAQGYGHQYMRNMLQMNNGDGSFREIGQVAGISNTDWSWAVLMADFDNDGYKDIFVSNGYRKDTRDNDFLIKVDKKRDAYLAGEGPILTQYDVAAMDFSETRLKNYYFENNGDLTFSQKTTEYGLDLPSFSNGATYADLDNDGDLDLVVNNLIDSSFLYRNNAGEQRGNNWLRVRLEGEAPNTAGMGAQVSIYNKDQIQFQELTLTRGFQSSVERALHFGLGQNTKVERMLVRWPDGRSQEFTDVDVNHLLRVYQKNAGIAQDPDESVGSEKLFEEYTLASGIDFVHRENEFDDYAKEILLPHKMSRFGPNFASGDVNGDGLEDLYVGGAAGQAGALYLQAEDASFKKQNGPWQADKAHEDLGSTFFDADGDGDLDLYVVSGGSEFEAAPEMLQDRLYLNVAGNVWKRGTLPEISGSGSCVMAGDYDNDGDQDLFVGGRVLPGKYPFPAQSYILRNEGGTFVDVTEEIAPGLSKIGLVSSAVWTDHNRDGQLDLILVGEWMPITVFENKEGQFQNMTEQYGLENTIGWWNKIAQADIDGDGDMDYIAGNYGLNSKFKVSVEEPLHIYCHDFDNSGTLDIVLGYYNDGNCYPVRGRQCSSEQMPNIKEKFPTYDQFGRASLKDVYGQGLEEALHYEAKTFASVYIQNNGNGSFEITPLPFDAQLSSVFGIIPDDFDQDGKMDLLLAGNWYWPEVETGREDAGVGTFLKGDGAGNFSVVNFKECGFFANLDVKDLVQLKGGQSMIVVANNDSRVQVYKLRKAAIQ